MVSACNTPEGRRRRWFTFERVLAGGAMVVLALSLIYTDGALPHISACAFRTVTGLPCPGCGLTRAFCAISHGQWAAAWDYNPFGFVWYALALFLAIRPVLLGWPAYVERERCWTASRWMYILPVVLVAAMWAFGLWRMLDVARPHATVTIVQSVPPASPRREP